MVTKTRTSLLSEAQVPDRVRRILACPFCHVAPRFEDGALRCATCGRAFQLRGAVPIMLEGSPVTAGESSLRRRISGYPPAKSLLRLTDRAAADYRSPEANRRLPALIAAAGEGATLLNIGSGQTRHTPDMVNIDIDAFPQVDIVGDAQQLPIVDAAADLAICSALLEHVPDPAAVVAEMRRTLRPGGVAFVETPFLQPYHEGPDDYQRYTIMGLRRLFSGFTVLECGVVGGPASTFCAAAREFGAITFSFGNETAYKLLRRAIALPLFPLRYLDALLVRLPLAHRAAFGLYLVARREA